MTAPRATYRLQLHRAFTMRDAARLAGQLAELGASHVYLSPILQATPGSTHGYDGVDPERIDEDRGGADAFEHLRDACVREGLGIMLDIVPNHLDISSAENRWWRSVLEHGPASPWGQAFDIDWIDEPEERDRGVLAPVLGERLPDALTRHRIRLDRDHATLRARYFDHAFPLSPRTYDVPLAAAAARVDDPDVEGALRDLTARASGLPDATEAAQADEQSRRIETAGALVRDLGVLLEARPAAATALDEALASLSESADELLALLERQNYRLAFWRRAAAELNYRRFFDITTLIGVRVERPEVFDAVHRLVLELSRRDGVDGLRVDHPDGLRDPATYFRRLADAAPGAWILAEKILEPGEPLRDDWPIAGTTGYDFLNDAMGVLIDPEGEAPLTDLYRDFAGAETDFSRVVGDAKRLAARELLAADLARLVRLLRRLAERHPGLRDTDARLGDAVATLAASMEVYRTYVVPERAEIGELDAQLINHAADRAAAERADLAPQPLDTIHDLLLLRLAPPVGSPRPGPEDDFVARFQQYSAPVTAKGVEDTAFYRFNRFIALNEVGGSPDRFGLSPENFHGANLRRAARWPLAMLATSTHDTKRSEDVRARLCVISELPDEWAEAVRGWAGRADAIRPPDAAPLDRTTEYFIYQTLVGAWPIDAQRMIDACTKAAREAKQHTSWLDQNEPFERAIGAFITAVLEDGELVRSLEAFVRRVLRPGRVNSLTQVLLKCTCPGVPDIYQGCELWDRSLVDPDNRRPVDHELRRTLLARLETADPADVWATLDDPDDPGLPKLWTIRQALHARRDHPEAFSPEAGYDPVAASGRHALRVLAFVRTDAQRRPRAISIVPRLGARLGGWGDTAIDLPAPARGPAWIDRLTRREVAPGPTPLGALLDLAPLVLLTEETP